MDDVIEPINQFRYLGVLIFEYRISETEVKAQIAVANDAFNRWMDFLKRNMTLPVNKNCQGSGYDLQIYIDVHHGP